MYKNMLKLVSGNASANLLALLAMPFLSRLYSPEVFGVYGTLFSVAAIAAIALSMRMELIILESDVVSLSLRACLLFMLCSLPVVGMLVLFYAVFIAEVSMLLGICLISTSVLICLFQIFSSVHSKDFHFGLISVSNVIRAATLVFFQVVLFFIFGSAVESLLVALLGSYLLALVFLIGKSSCFGRGKESHETLHQVISYMYRKKDTAIYAGGQSLVNTLSQSLPYFILPLYAGPEFIGLFFFADRAFRTPLTLVGQPIRQVFLSYCHRESDSANQKKYFYKLTSYCFLFAFCISCFLFVFGEYAFENLFGESYRSGGNIAAWLSVWGVGAFVGFPALALLRARGHSKKIFYIESWFTLLKGTALIVSGFFYTEPLASIVVFSLISAVMGFYLFNVGRKSLRV